MDELALFAGAGGGLLGSVLCGWRTVAAVELDARCREILFARQRDGCLDRFSVWDDVQTFDGSPWRGRVGLLTGGFPCPKWSTARRGRGDPPDLWPHMLHIVDETEAPRVLAENVSRDPIERAACDLLRRGYDCTIFEASASGVGAPHHRPRWWLAADANPQEHDVEPIHEEMASVCAGSRHLWDEHPSFDHDVADGVARGLDRYEAGIGNGQVPQVVHAVARALGWAR